MGVGMGVAVLKAWRDRNWKGEGEEAGARLTGD